MTNSLRLLTWSELLILLARRTWTRWQGAKPKACASPSSVEQRSQRVQGRVRVGSTGVITSVRQQQELDEERKGQGDGPLEVGHESSGVGLQRFKDRARFWGNF